MHSSMKDNHVSLSASLERLGVAKADHVTLKSFDHAFARRAGVGGFAIATARTWQT